MKGALCGFPMLSLVESRIHEERGVTMAACSPGYKPCAFKQRLASLVVGFVCVSLWTRRQQHYLKHLGVLWRSCLVNQDCNQGLEYLVRTLSLFRSTAETSARFAVLGAYSEFI
jgi:hypothetical protein